MDPENQDEEESEPGPAEYAALDRRDDLANVTVSGDANSGNKTRSGTKKADPAATAEQRLEAAIGKLVACLDVDSLAEIKRVLRGAQPAVLGTCLMHALKLRVPKTGI